MKYRDPAMDGYFFSLPPAVRDYINSTGVEISTYGELMQIGEHFRHSLGAEENQRLF